MNKFSHQLRIGTSGWHYKDWVGRFYPAKMPSHEFLDYYSRFYDTVELNGVFYRMPKPESVKNWYRNSPKGFLFAYKASRFLTHMKKLTDPQDPLKRLFKLADLLKDKLGPILYQLPHFFPVNRRRLEDFFKALPRGYDHVMEFRNPTWFTEEVYDLLEKYRVNLCLYDMKSKPSPVRLTGPVAYLRMHGSEEKYAGNYPPAALKDYASQIKGWLRAKRRVFVYFNNDTKGHAIKNADELKELLGIS